MKIAPPLPRFAACFAPSDVPAEISPPGSLSACFPPSCGSCGLSPAGIFLPLPPGKLSPVLAEEQENRLFFVRKAGITSCYSIFITRVRLTAPFFLLFLLFLCRSPPDQTKDGIFSIALSSSACSSASVLSRKNNTLFSGAISPTSGNQRKIYSSRVQFRE